jgi:hypothetical protein
VKAGRQTVSPDNIYRRVEKATSEVITAGLDLYRDVRDAAMESLFFQIYGPPAVLGVAAEPTSEGTATDPRDLPIVQDALDAIGTGGYPEALALIGALVGRGAGRISLGRLEMVEEFIRSDEVISKLDPNTLRRLKAEQAVVAELAPQRGLKSLPLLLADPADRRRALEVLDEAVKKVEPTAKQLAMVEGIRSVLGAKMIKRTHDERRRSAHEPLGTNC